MTKGLLVMLALFCLTGAAGAMGSMNFDLSWRVMGGGGGSILPPSYSIGGHGGTDHRLVNQHQLPVAGRVLDDG